ncbi:hypothetical protein LJC07_07355 [Christensenellaceae bacterium OttesenSCG-928-L17]|nr:hypothetical protein [Christensenellaceae bacterium OttesenSCG-928-L17]
MLDCLNKLIELYHEGNETHITLKAQYNDIVPFAVLNWDTSPEYALNPKNAKKLLKKNQSFKEYSDRIESFGKNWVGAVKIELAKLGVKRYCIDFDQPKHIGSIIAPQSAEIQITPKIPGMAETLEVRKLTRNLNMLTGYVRTLSNIICDLEKTVESARAHMLAEETIIAVYDDKKHAITIGTSTIVFNKNAPFSPTLCSSIFSNKKKLWTLEELLRTFITRITLVIKEK